MAIAHLDRALPPFSIEFRDGRLAGNAAIAFMQAALRPSGVWLAGFPTLFWELGAVEDGCLSRGSGCLDGSRGCTRLSDSCHEWKRGLQRRHRNVRTGPRMGPPQGKRTTTFDAAPLRHDDDRLQHKTSAPTSTRYTCSVCMTLHVSRDSNLGQCLTFVA